MRKKEAILFNFLEMIQALAEGNSTGDAMDEAVQLLEDFFTPHDVHVVMFQFDSKEEQLTKFAGSKVEKLQQSCPYAEKGKYPFTKEDFGYLAQPIFIPDIDADDRREAFKEIAKAFHFRSFWTLPLKASNHDFLGIMMIGFYNLYTPDIHTVNKLKLCSRLIAVSLELSQFIEEPREQEHTVANDRLSLVDLERGLEQQEFLLYYQPYVSLEEEEVGVEALIRWKHPKKGFLTPGDFLPLAEKNGFILRLEKWVLEKAIQDIKEVNDILDTELHLSINISANHLNVKDFPKMVVETLEQYRFSPQYLTLEITERILVDPQSITVLKRLKNKGIRISIDDFGTAYSALHYLKNLPVDELKIDRSFISDITDDRVNQNIVEVIIRLGKDLNLTVVAEGVETKEQLDLLREMNCSQVQGFYFSKPLPLEHFVSSYKNKEFSVV